MILTMPTNPTYKELYEELRWVESRITAHMDKTVDKIANNAQVQHNIQNKKIDHIDERVGKIEKTIDWYKSNIVWFSLAFSVIWFVIWDKLKEIFKNFF